MLKSFQILDALKIIESYIEVTKAFQELYPESSNAVNKNIELAEKLKESLISLFPKIKLTDWESNSTPESVNKIIDQSPSDH